MESSLGALATCKAIRETAKADELVLYLPWDTRGLRSGTDEQVEVFQRLTIEDNHVLRGAVIPRDNDPKISDNGYKIVF